MTENAKPIAIPGTDINIDPSQVGSVALGYPNFPSEGGSQIILTLSDGSDVTLNGFTLEGLISLGVINTMHVLQLENALPQR